MNTILWDYESLWPNVWRQNICRTLWPIFHGPVILPCILNTIQWLTIILLEYESVWHNFWPQNKYRSLWPIFHGPVIVAYSLKPIYVWTSLVGIMNQCDLTHDLKINVGHWPIFHGPVILRYILKTIWCMYIILSEYESVWPEVWSQNVCRSLWPIFHGPVILCYIMKTIFDVWTSSLGIMGRYDWTFDFKINVCHRDLYFIVHWFCLISQRLFDVLVSYFQILRKCDPNLDLKINIGQHDLYFMV